MFHLRRIEGSTLACSAENRVRSAASQRRNNLGRLTITISYTLSPGEVASANMC